MQSLNRSLSAATDLTSDFTNNNGQADDSSDFNWDPLSFAVTLFIGLIALTFAAATVLQGIFNTSSGRRKTTFSAIGPWSKLTTRRWIWYELRRESVAWTPIITERTLMSMLAEDELQRGPEKPENSYLALKNAYSTLLGPPDSVVATWLQLLFYGRVHRTSGLFDNGSPDHLGFLFLRDTVADRLPSDIQAVPAYAEVRCLVVLGVAIGCNKLKLDPDNGYPLLTGDGNQLRFRRSGDPYLGLCAVFERYNNRDFDWACKFDSSGRWHLGVIQATLAIQTFNSSLKLEFKSLQDDSKAHGQPQRRHSGSGSQDSTCPHGRLSCLCLCPNFIQHAKEIPCSPMANVNFGWFLAYPPPTFVPVAFPTRKSKLLDRLDCLVLQSPFWRLAAEHELMYKHSLFFIKAKKTSLSSPWHIFHGAVNLVGGLGSFPPSEFEHFRDASASFIVSTPRDVEDETLSSVFQAVQDKRRYSDIRIQQKTLEELRSVDETLASLDVDEGQKRACVLTEVLITAWSLFQLRDLRGALTAGGAKRLSEEETRGFSSPTHDGSVKAFWTLDNLRRFYQVAGYDSLNSGVNTSPGSEPHWLSERVARLLETGESHKIEDREQVTVLFRWLHRLAWGSFPPDDFPSDAPWYYERDPTEPEEFRDKDLRYPIPDKHLHLGPVEFLKKFGTYLDLLVYRAILLTLLLHYALDDSDVWDAEIEDHIVPFL